MSSRVHLPGSPGAALKAARFGVRGCLVLVLLPTLVVPLAGQSRPGEVALRVEASSGVAQLQLDGVLDDEALRSAVDEGLPLRILVTTELWRDRFLFDAQEATEEWRASVIRDPLTGRYRVETEALSLGGETGAATLDAAGALLHEAFSATVRPSREGRFYYRAEVELETLSPNDLEELRRWLRGDLAPVVEGEERVEDALFRGLGRVFVRMLRLPSRTWQLSSPTFSYSPGGDEDIFDTYPSRRPRYTATSLPGATKEERGAPSITDPKLSP